MNEQLNEFISQCDFPAMKQEVRQLCSESPGGSKTVPVEVDAICGVLSVFRAARRLLVSSEEKAGAVRDLEKVRGPLVEALALAGLDTWGLPLDMPLQWFGGDNLCSRYAKADTSKYASSRGIIIPPLGARLFCPRPYNWTVYTRYGDIDSQSDSLNLADAKVAVEVRVAQLDAEEANCEK